MNVVTRAQKPAIERARENAIIPAEATLSQQSTSPTKKKVPKSKPKQATSKTTLLSEMHELDLARDFVRYKYPVTLPPSYNPPDMPAPKGDMVVVAVKAQRETKDKAAVWVEFLSPPSHTGRQIQLYPRSVERKHGPAKGADFSLLTAIRAKHPMAKTWLDLGVHTYPDFSASQPFHFQFFSADPCGLHGAAEHMAAMLWILHAPCISRWCMWRFVFIIFRQSVQM